MERTSLPETSRPKETARSVLRRLLRSSDATIAPVFALALVPMLMAVGIGVDLSRAGSMHASLQAMTDKAAVSGAAAAFGTTTQMNSATDTTLLVGDAVYQSEPLPVNLNITPASTAITTTGTAAAPPVTVTATSTANFRPTFLSIWASQMAVTATTVVSAGGPSNGPGAFPFAMGKCLFTHYWNAATQQPINNGPTNPIAMDSTYDQGNNDPTCTKGQWTSLTSNSNSESYIAGLMAGGCGCSLTTQTDIFIQSGAKAAAYGDAIAQNFVGQTVLIPVVTQDDLSTNVTTGVYAFAAFHITAIVKTGNNKQIDGYFVANYHAAGASGTSGAYLGVANVQITQ